MGVNIGFQFFKKNGDTLPESGFTDYGDSLFESPIFEPVIRWEQIEITTHNTDAMIYSESYFKLLELKFKIQKEDLDFFFFENCYNESDKPKMYSVDEVIDKFNKYISIFDTEDFLGTSVKDKNTNKLVSHFAQNYPFSEIGDTSENLANKEYRMNYLHKLRTENFYLENNKKIEVVFVEETTLKAYKNIIDDFSACLEEHRGYYMAGTWW